MKYLQEKSLGTVWYWQRSSPTVGLECARRGRPAKSRGGHTKHVGMVVVVVGGVVVVVVVVGVTQLPWSQSCSAPHAVPHVPQFSGSVSVSVQLPLHFVSPLGH